jgi:hypothetical protein
MPKSILYGLTLSVALCACADARTGIDCASPGDPVPSVLGINYGKYAPPLPAILSRGEAERVAAIPNFASLDRKLQRAVKQEWRAMLKRLFNGTLSPTFTGGDEPDFDLLRAAAPNMLAALKACGPSADARLSYLDGISLESPAGDQE